MQKYNTKDITRLTHALASVWNLQDHDFKLCNDAAMVMHGLIPESADIDLAVSSDTWELLAKFHKPIWDSAGARIVLPGNAQVVPVMHLEPVATFERIMGNDVMSLGSLRDSYKGMSGIGRIAVKCNNYINLINTRLEYLADNDSRRAAMHATTIAEDALALVMQLNMSQLFTDGKKVTVPFKDAGGYNWVFNVNGEAKTIEFYERDAFDMNDEVKVYTVKLDIEHKHPVGLK